MTMEHFTIDTNFFISGFQPQPQAFKKFAEITKKLNIKINITSYIKGEMRHFLLREILPHISVSKVDTEEFNSFLSQVYSLTANVPQKPDLSVIFIAHKMKSAIVSSDLKLLETAELLGIPTYTNSAFIRYIIENNDDTKYSRFLQDLKSRLFSEEIRYSVSSTNRYDPVKRISKIVESAISVIRAEYEEKLADVKIGDLKGGEEFSIQSLQLKELLGEIKKDFEMLEKDFQEEKYEQLEKELITRVREITDAIVDWRLATEDIEDHPTYNSALVMLGRLQYLVCICLIENKKIELARVYMDKLLMILFQNSRAVDELGMDVHFLRIILLLLSEQLQRLPSYFTVAFEDTCIKRNRADLANLIHPLILLSVVLGTGKIEETAVAQSYEDIEFINQLGFKFMQLGKSNKAKLMFKQSFFLALNSENYGLCILSLEFLCWLYFAGLEELKTLVDALYQQLITKSPKVKDSYYPSLQHRTSKSDLKKFTNSSFQSLDEYPEELKSPYYVLSTETLKIKGIGYTPIIRTMNWDVMARIGIVDEKRACIDRATLGSIIYPISGNYKIVEASSYIKKRYNLELLIFSDPETDMTMVIKSPGGSWHLPQPKEVLETISEI